MGHDSGQPIAQATGLALVTSGLIFREKGHQRFLGSVFGIGRAQPEPSADGEQNGPIAAVKLPPDRIVGPVLEAFQQDGACARDGRVPFTGAFRCPP